MYENLKSLFLTLYCFIVMGKRKSKHKVYFVHYLFLFSRFIMKYKF